LFVFVGFRWFVLKRVQRMGNLGAVIKHTPFSPLPNKMTTHKKPSGATAPDGFLVLYHIFSR